MKTKCWKIVAAGLLVSLLSGCGVFLVGAGVAAGVGVGAYIEGELKTTDAVSFDTAWNAALAGVTKMEFTITDQTHDALAGKIVARGAQDRRAEVNVKRVTDATTEIRIRVGTLGDEAASRQLLDKIRSSYPAK